MYKAQKNTWTNKNTKNKRKTKTKHEGKLLVHIQHVTGTRYQVLNEEKEPSINRVERKERVKNPSSSRGAVDIF